jgi:SAM-dependent methyltransferase
MVLVGTVNKFLEKIRRLLYLSPIHKIPSNFRICHDKELLKQFSLLQNEKKSLGVVLDVGSKEAPYKNKIRYNKLLTLDIDKKVNPDICSDVHKIRWKSNYFDTIFVTNVLEHLYDPQRAIDQFYRILKPNGYVVASTPFFYAYHPDPMDYYRFSQDSLVYLFKKFKKVEIISFGNRLQLIWHALSFGKPAHFLFWFNYVISIFNWKSKKFPIGFIVVAKK